MVEGGTPPKPFYIAIVRNNCTKVGALDYSITICLKIYMNILTADLTKEELMKPKATCMTKGITDRAHINIA